MNQPAGFFSPVLLALLSLSACGRVVKLHHSQEEAAVQLPDGASCATDTVLPDAATPVCAEEQAWPSWTSATPPGICYELLDACSGLPDHAAYLTFDDGPADWTPAILDTLAEHAVRATFFVNARGDDSAGRLQGSFRDGADRSIDYRDVLERIVMEGHALGNHTRDHADLGTLTAEEIALQYAENERLVNQALYRSGAAPRPLTLLRPPYGSPWMSHAAQRALVGQASQRFGYNVLWNVDSGDSKEWVVGEASTFEELRGSGAEPGSAYRDKVARLRTAILDDALVQAGKGVVILLHDTHNSTRDALLAIIDGLRAQGYRFETLEDQVRAQFGRSSLELTPGPALQQRCGESERARSCQRSEQTGQDVCGRFWLAYEQLGGQAVIGEPTAPPRLDDLWSQAFERGRIELHPDWAAPCDVVFVPEI